MYRWYIFVAALAVGTFGPAAATHAADTDAKGTIKIDKISVDKGIVTVTVTRNATAGWTPGTVRVFACAAAGGYRYTSLVPFADTDCGASPQTERVTLPLPNGNYAIWATHTVSTPGPPADRQTIGSDLASASVTQSAVANLALHGGVGQSANRLIRQQGGTNLIGSGTYTVDATHESYTVYLDAIPVNGGVLRTGTARVRNGGNWSKAVVPVNADLKYNVIAIQMVRVASTDGDPQPLGSAWAKNK